MTTTKAEIRTGAYYDSVILMQLQRALADLPGVLDAGVVMGTPANKDLLEASGLLGDAARRAAADDLIIVIRAADEATAQSALARVDELLAKRRTQTASAYRPKTLDSAAKQLPHADWVMISVPGRYAAGVAGHALDLGKNVFLYSDNVSLDDEIKLKQRAADKGLLVMGPDCGTAIVDGVGLGFANRVRRGNIGLVGASGTGLQVVTARIHQLGGGISAALGTGGRDLSEKVGAITARQSLQRLAEDPDTEVIVLISKPPAPAVAAELLTLARSAGKPVVVNFIGYDNAEAQSSSGAGKIVFARTLDETAELATALAAGRPTISQITNRKSQIANHNSPPYLRGLFSGGTLAYEALLLLQDSLPEVYSNVPLKGGPKLANAHRSQSHTIVDLGEDEFTVGRLHPMLDNDLRIRRLLEEAADSETAVILLDVVLGDGAHPDPAAELAPAIEKAIGIARAEGRTLAVVAVLVGTDLDPQGMDSQIERLAAAGAAVFTRNDEAVRAAAALLTANHQSPTADRPPTIHHSPFTIRHSPFTPFSALNVGLESFAQSLSSQGAAVVHVDWRPPAGGNEKLMGLLVRMR